MSQIDGLAGSFSANLLRGLLRATKTLSVESYVVGGTVRDCLQGKVPGDLDVTVSGRAALFAKALQRELGGGTLIDLSGPDDEAVRVVFRGEQVDISAFRSGATSILEDLQSRDFTINALAVPLLDFVDKTVEGESWSLLDPTGGQEDLRAGFIRHCSGAFEADPVRMLRGYRFSATLGFTVVEKTKQAIRKQAAAITGVAAERVSYELNLIFASPRTAETLREMGETDLLRLLIPELYHGQGVAQPEFHHLDVMDHCFLALSMMETIIAEPGRFFPGLEAELTAYLKKAKVVQSLKWAALLHDIGKPVTKDVRTDTGRVTFYCHEDEGKKLFDQYATRLKWSRTDSELVGGLIGMHMHPFHLCNVQREKEKISKRAALKLCHRAGDELAGLFMLAMSDSLASRGEKKPEQMEEELVTLFETVQKIYRDDIAPVLQGPRLVTGKDLIEKFKLVPGPLFSTILGELEALQVEGQVVDRQSAFAWVGDYLRKRDR